MLINGKIDWNHLRKTHKTVKDYGEDKLFDEQSSLLSVVNLGTMVFDLHNRLKEVEDYLIREEENKAR